MFLQQTLEVVIEHTFKPRQLRSCKKAPLHPKIATIQQEDDGYKSILSVVPEVLGDPVVSMKLMNHFKERMRPRQAENMMKWLMSIGDVEDEDLEDIMEGRREFSCKSSEFIL
jgi:hypothetical protein